MSGTLPFFQVDAFAHRPFVGNPAAVMPLTQWLPDAVMQSIAEENNLAETAFLVPSHASGVDYDLRWFTPTTEVDLCGHATLASAHIVMEANRVSFGTRSGILTVERRDGLYWVDLPAGTVKRGDNPALLDALGLSAETPLFLGNGGNGTAIVLLADAAAVRALDPDFRKLAQFNVLVSATAPGSDTDIVSRVFAPYHGIDEDPVTGSAHGSLVPFWAARLETEQLTAFQASARGGRIECRYIGDRVVLGGPCRTVIEGRFTL